MLMQLRSLKYSGLFICTTERYLLLIATTLCNSEIIHWGIDGWNSRQMLSATEQQKAASYTPNHPSSESSPHMPYVMGKYEPKNGTDNIQPTACELPWLQRKGAWTALRSYACPADVAPCDPNHTSRQPYRSASCSFANNRPLQFCLICPIV